MARMKPSLSPDTDKRSKPVTIAGVFVASGFVAVAIGSALATWAYRDDPRSIVVSSAAFPISYGLVAWAWWRWIIMATQDREKRKQIRMPCWIFASAGIVMAIGYVAYTYHTLESGITGLMTAQERSLLIANGVLSVVGFCLVSCGFWITSTVSNGTRRIPEGGARQNHVDAPREGNC